MRTQMPSYPPLPIDTNPIISLLWRRRPTVPQPEGNDGRQAKGTARASQVIALLYSVVV
ncbi:hypothetical protein B0T17DRAFT_514481 [Bombardia bombarda]|uniref:Uncharacterized protein n=1 Tax=Bombardia bombarda TaxID=252184 RepID=A0AA39XJJ3_9PEZI|nr:hypothetical protein B0T17DRAFT_514481 [Bombardia bombarda]